MALIENPSNKVLDDQIRTAISVVAQQLNTKARLGAVAQSFDPDAVDGDGDGLVQDGSPFERPAVISAVSKASQRIGQLLSKAGRSKESRARAYQRRYSGMSAQDIAKDAVPDSFEGWVALAYEKLRVDNPDLPPLSPDMTPDEVKQTVRALEDFVESDLVWLMTDEKAKEFKELKKTDRAAAFRLAVDGAFDFSPEAVAKNRELLEHVLTTNPQYRALVDKFGHPSIFRFGPDLNKSHLAEGMFSDSAGMGLSKIGNVRKKSRLQPFNRGLGKWFMQGIMEPEVGHRKTKRWLSDNTPEGLLVHEYGHYLVDAIKAQLSDVDNYERTKRWQAFRFGAGADWKETLTEIGHPEWYDQYAIEKLKKTERIEITRIRKDVPDELPHVLTAYGETAPAGAWAEAIAALFAHEGRNKDLVSPGMVELVNAALELPEGSDPTEALLPARSKREIVPDGFASRGSVMAINNERDSRYGEIQDPYELTAEVLGDLGKDDPVGQMVRKLEALKDDPERWDKVEPKQKASIERSLNLRKANEEEAALLAGVLINDPAFADMIRRHGISNYYFAQEDMRFPIGDGTDDEIDIRGSLYAGFTPDESDGGRFWPPRIVIDMLGPSSLEEDQTLDVPIQPVSDEEIRKARKAMNIPGGVTRTHVSKSHQHVIRHEGGHSVHDLLWERVHRGEIKGRRAQLIRAYGTSTWEEFYKELGRPDLLLEYQRSTKAANTMGYPGSLKPGDEIAFIDSGYAWSNPREFFAETFASYTSSNPAYRELMNDTALEHMQAMLGDADSGSLEEPPSVDLDMPGDTDVPEPPAWDGFASSGGEKPKSYGDVRRNRIKEGKGKFSRSDTFRNTTTEQKVDLAVPTNEQDYMLMAWDHIFERLGLDYETVKKIDLTDPANPKLPRRWKGALDGLDFYVAQMQRDMPDFSPDKVKANRDALRASLDAFPRMREAAERLGMPPLTSMTEATKERLAIEYFLAESNDMFRSGKVQNIRSEFLDILPVYRQYAAGEMTWQQMLDDPAAANFSKYIQKLQDDGTIEKYAKGINGGFSRMSETILMPGDASNAFVEGKRYDPKFVPEAGDWGITGNSYEEVLLHEYAHYVDARLSSRSKDGDPASIKDQLMKGELFGQANNHIKTKYGQTNMSEFAAEAISAIMSGNRDAEEMLSPEARQWARRVAGFPEKDPVFTGRIPGKKPSEAEVLADRFGQLWRRTTDGLMEALDKENGVRSRDGVPDVLETFGDAVRRTGLKPLPDVNFEHEGRKFTMRDNGTVFEIDVNGRTVATASVVEGQGGLPELNTVDVLPGYEGIAPDQDLHDMVVDHARTKFPSARAPKRARKTEVVTEGFASMGPEHHDARGIDGTPGTPEYAQSVATELEAARASGKKVFFDYNGETREVEVTEVFDKNGILYMKGNDALRNGEERMFRLDRVSMPKRVQNPETGANEIAKRPGKPPRKPVPVFTGKAAEIFEGAKSWDEVAQRLSKGRYVFFDFETTGIEEGEFGEMMHPGAPTQIGLVEIVDGKVTRRWSTHVNPGRPLSVDPKTGRSWSADNLKYKDPVTGELVNISDEWLATQKPLKDALEEMLEFIGPDTILGGQNHPYDDDVMKRALADAGIDESRWSPAGFIDSQALAQSLLDKNSDDYPVNEKGSKTVSLGYLAKFLGHDMGDGWHSADADSEASWEAFSRLVKRAADQENSGKPVRRDLFAPGGAIKEHQERLDDYERQKRGWDYKVKKYQESQAAQLPGENQEGFASTGSTRRAKNPARWETLTPEEREAATQASAQAAVNYINALQDAGIDVATLRDLDRAELDSILRDLVPGGEARVSDYVTGDGKALIEVSNATMGKVFMSLGFHVQVISDDPNEHHLLENGINDMQKALQDYVASVAKDPDALLKDVIFMDWADKNGINLGSLKGKKLEKAAKKFAEEFEINLCLYYKSGSNMLCGANIGIEREEMPQLGGRMKGDDTLAAKAIKAGLMAAKEIKLDPEKMAELEKRDPAMAARIKELANAKGEIKKQENLEKIKELAMSKDPIAKAIFDSMNWNDSEANVEPIADKAAAALGITVDKPRFVDPATMLGAQNQLQGSKVENMADGAVEAVLEALPILEARFGRKPTQAELMDYLANEIKHGLFQPTLTAGLPGGQTYMLDGHHRWSGLLMANKKLEAMGLDIRVQLNIKNYQTDIRSGLELGRSIQVAMGVKDAKLAGEDPFEFNPDAPDLTPEEFDKVVSEILDPANLVEKIREVREGGKFRETEAADVPGGQEARLAPRKRPIQDVVDEITGQDIALDPESRVKGVKPAKTGYRAAGSGSGWQSVEDHIAVEMERGNKLFDTHQEYVDKGYEVAWVTHSPGEAGRYVVSAGDVAAWQSGEIKVKPEDIAEVDMSGAILVGTDGEGGFLYARRKQSRAAKQRVEMLKAEEDYLDQMLNSIPGQGEEAFASTSRDRINKRGLVDRFMLLRNPVGEEARDLKLDAGSINKPTAMDPDKFYQIVGDVPGISESDELLATEKLTSSRVRNLKMYRATYAGKKGKKNRVFGTYKTRDGQKYSIAQDQDGIEGAYYAYRGDKRLDESKRVAKLTLILNDGEKNVHDLFSIHVNEEDRKAGLAQALVEVAKADFPDATFTVQRVVTQDGANFAQNLEEEGFASTGTISVPLDLVSGGGNTDSSMRGGAAQRDREVVPDDWNTRQQKRIAGVRVPDHLRDEYGAPIPGAPIYRETIKIGRKKYTFEADVNGLVTVYTGRNYKQVAQLNLDRGHSMAGGARAENPNRHYIDFVSVDKKHRRKGIATQMAVIAEHAYGGSVEHSTALSDAGRAWRDADVKNRGAAALPLRDGAPTIDSVFNEGFASRGNFQPIPTQNEDLMGDSSLDQLADKLNLDELETPSNDFDEIEQMAARIAGRIAGGEATLAEKLGITPEQLKVRYRELAKEINDFVDRFVQDKDVRKNVKLGYKILSHAAILFGAKGMKDFLSTINPSAQGTGSGSDASSLLDIVDIVLSTGLHDALVAYGMNFANLIATEYAAMRLVSKQKAKDMIEDIRARIEGTGQKIGVMSTEMWNRLRGAWAKTRATAPIPATTGIKEWIIAGSSPIWAEMSWFDYQAKSRITQHLEPTNQAIWSKLAVKTGRSPELIDIAAYRAGIGYGKRRVKSKDVVRVYL